MKKKKYISPCECVIDLAAKYGLADGDPDTPLNPVSPGEGLESSDMLVREEQDWTDGSSSKSRRGAWELW